MAIAEPLKDFFIHSVFFKPLYPSKEKKSSEDKRIKELAKKSQIGKLLKILVKDMNISGLTMVVKNPAFKQFDYFKENNRKARKIETEDLIQILEYLQEPDQKYLPGGFPVEISEFREKYGWQTIIPILYKSTLFGFFVFIDLLETRRREVFESLSSRIALLLENDLLAESALKKESYEKEFSAARKIEKILAKHKALKINEYSVLFNQFNESDEDTPVLFENSLSFSGKNNNNFNYIIYCKISRANKKKITMMLFIISGYFLAFSRDCSTVKKMAQLLNETIFNIGSEFGIEGFLIEYKQNLKWSIAYFGHRNRLEVDTKKVNLLKTDPLGLHKNSTFKMVELKNKNDIKLGIFQHSEVTIKRNEK
jgi:hypothetical protein